jgi:hypothetical protein
MLMLAEEANISHSRRASRVRRSSGRFGPRTMEHKAIPRIFVAASLDRDEEIVMRSKLIFAAFLIASLFAATALASERTDQAAGASATSNAMASMRHHHHHWRHHHIGYSRRQMDLSRPGGRPVSRKAPGE